MARLPDEVVERIKREISVERLAEARGIKLRRSGKELIGLCPFHKDTNPSLNIDPVKNVWQCKGACGKSGSVIDWVMLAEGISVRHALELLCRDYLPSAANATEPPPKQSTVPKLPPLFEPTADDQKVLAVVVNHYHETLKNAPESPKAKQYLLHRGLQSSEMIEHFRLGFSNRTLNYHLPDKNRAVGAEIRGRLEKLGILREETGHEHFNGSVVIPIFNLEGEVAQMYGRKITRITALRDGTPAHLYLPGPHRGVWNEPALIASKEIILCEALIDALTFWCAGYRHVTTSYGVNGFTAEIKAAFRKHGTKRIYIAYDRDDAGERAALKHAEELIGMGIECFRVQFPRGQDANEFALKQQPAAHWLGMYLQRAAWLGKGQRPTVAVIEAQPVKPQLQTEEETIKPAAKEEIPEPVTTPAEDKMPESVPPLAAKAEEPITAAKEKISEPITTTASEEHVSSLAAPLPIAPLPTGTVVPVRDVRVEISGETVYVTMGERRYRIVDLGKNTAPGVLHVNVMVTSTSMRGETRLHVDRFDLYGARPRSLFAKQAAKELGHKEESIEHDLARLILELEDLQREWLEKTLTPQEEKLEMTVEEKSAALELLRDPRLLERVLEDFEKCGVVGEETNKKTGYLAAVSRLLEKPLAIVVQSASSAGKSSLMEAVLDFMPEEQRENYTAMTGQALFYMGQKNLKHKILAISEQQGADRASYPLKLLQSEGVLKIASTGKDPVSGKLVTHDYEVEGPVMLFLTTTAQEVDEELMNRAIALTVNEDREQTRAIHQRQREARTIEGHLVRRKRAKLINLHRNAQRLLRPIAVVNNHDVGEFPDTMTRARRDHNKFLTLIDAVALLHQHQRELKSITDEDGETLEYIEATEADVKLAQALADQVGLKPSLDELRPQTRNLLWLITDMAKSECGRSEIAASEYRFTRRTVREYTKWGDTQLRQHLRKLEEMEYLIVRRGGNQGQLVVYQLPTSEQEANHSSNFAGSEGNFAGVNDDFAGGVRSLRGPEKNDKSPVLTQVPASTSRLCGNAYRGSEAAGVPQNAIVAEGKPNGHGLARRAQE
jgi:DNA primase catalytic core